MIETGKQLDAVVVGDLFVDIVLSGFSTWPKPGEEVFAEKLVREAGGGAAITACGLARLGARTGVFGVTGREDGVWLTDRLKSFGVDTTGLQSVLTRNTGITVAVTSDEDRTFFTHLGANTELPGLLRERDVQRELAQARHVHFACRLEAEFLGELIEILQAEGCRVSLDIGWHPDWLRDKRSMGALAKIDLFLPNESEAEVMTGQSSADSMLEVFAAKQMRAVAIKTGDRGSVLLWNGKRMRCDPVKVEPVDTTGAGDSFDAGFIYGWLNGESPIRCLQIANICGALSTRALGGIASFPTRAEIEDSA